MSIPESQATEFADDFYHSGKPITLENLKDLYIREVAIAFVQQIYDTLAEGFVNGMKWIK